MKLLVLKSWLVKILWVDNINIGPSCGKEIEDVLMLESRVVELVLCVSCSTEVQGQRSVALIVYLIRIVTLSLSEKHFN